MQQEAVERADDAPTRVEHGHRGQHPRQEEYPQDGSGREAQAVSADHEHEHDRREQRPHQVTGAENPPQEVRRIGHNEGPRRQILRVLSQRPNLGGGGFGPESSAWAHALPFPSPVVSVADEARASPALLGAVTLSCAGARSAWRGAPSLLRVRDDR